MTCTGNFIRGLGLEPCPKPIDLVEHLKKMLFTEVQISWIIEYLKENYEVILNVSSIMEYPVNHNYGFDRKGWSILNSKYNVCISFEVPDPENKFTGRKSERILLIKNSQ